MFEIQRKTGPCRRFGVAGTTIVLVASLGLLLNVPSAQASGTDDFVLTWDTSLPGTSDTFSITIPTTGAGYAYQVDWNNDGDLADTDESIIHTGNASHTFGVQGVQTIRISGAFPRVYFNGSGDREKLISVDQWGSQPWVSMAAAFSGCSNLSLSASDSPDLTGVSSTAYMFRGVGGTLSDLSAWDTSAVTLMQSMFQDSTANPDLGNWNTENVTDMSHMFRDAVNADPDVSAWDTGNVTGMSNMFRDATSADPDVSGWNTGSVNSLSNMFRDADLANPNVSGWDTSNVVDMQSMFRRTGANPDVSNWNTAGVTNMFSMFRDTTTANPDVNGWETANVNTMAGMFRNAQSAEPDVSLWNTASVTTMANMFQQTGADPNVSAWNTISLLNTGYMFENTTSANPNVSGWNTTNLTNMQAMFRNAQMANPDVSTWDTANVTNMQSVFRETNFDPDVSNWITTNVTNMSYLFEYTPNADPDVSTWDTANVTDMSYTFRSSSSENLDVSGWQTGNVTHMVSMFAETEATVIDVSLWDTSNVESMQAMFRGTTATALDVSNWQVANLRNAQSLFLRTAANPDVTNWDTSSVADADYMFQESPNFDRDLSGWDLTAMTTMFHFLKESGLSIANYDATLASWGSQPLVSPVVFDGGDSYYCSSEADREALIGLTGWTITDAGRACTPATPTPVPILNPSTDSGHSSTDHITSSTSPSVGISCAGPGLVVRVYSDLPAQDTLVAQLTCSASSAEDVSLFGLVEGVHNLTYSASEGSAESADSPSLTIQVDITAPMKPSCTSPLELIGLNVPMRIECVGVEAGTTLSIPNMSCSPSPSGVSEAVVCTGTSGVNSAQASGNVDTSNDLISVVDAAGNTVTLGTEVTIDLAKPSIGLNGLASISIDQNTVFVDPGIICLDDQLDPCVVSYSGDVVDPTTPGTYVVIYYATDGAGNQADPVTRTIVVSASAASTTTTTTSATATTTATTVSTSTTRLEPSIQSKPSTNSPAEPRLTTTSDRGEPQAPSASGTPASEDALDSIADAAFVEEPPIMRPGTWLKAPLWLGLLMLSGFFFLLLARRRLDEEDEAELGQPT